NVPPSFSLLVRQCVSVALWILLNGRVKLDGGGDTNILVFLKRTAQFHEYHLHHSKSGMIIRFVKVSGYHIIDYSVIDLKDFNWSLPNHNAGYVTAIVWP
ncbi:unnamed protein product, partial [Scytosiphon promiscuus]